MSELNYKVNSVLLIDDDEPTNFLHKMVIERAHFAKNVITMTSAIEALEFLTLAQNGEYPQPEIIFLDINMPRMNGWEFLEEYEKLPADQKAKVVVVMLTTSINPDDAKKAKELGIISGFKNKPLSKEVLREIYQQNFG